MKNWLSITLLNNRFPALHGARVLAILGVIAVHVNMFGFKYHNEFYQGQLLYLKNLWFSMDFFFTLSGFLIGYILLHTLTNPKPGHIKRFYLRRGFRVFPLYYFVLFSLFFLNRPSDYDYGRLLHEIFYLTNYPFDQKYLMVWSWSLSLEEHFYLLAPGFMFLWLKIPKTIYRYFALFFLWLLCYGLKIVTVHSLDFSQIDPEGNLFLRELYTPSHLRFDAFAIGILCADLAKNYAFQLEKLFDQFWGWVILLLPLSFYIWTFFSQHTFPVLNKDQALVFVTQMGTLASLAHGLMILFLSFNKGWFSRFLSFRIWEYAAALGYGVYLVHEPIMQGFLHFERQIWPQMPASYSWFLVFSVTVSLSFMIAYALHLLVEKPLLKIRDRLVP